MLRFVVFSFVVLASVHNGSAISDDDKEAIHALLKPIADKCMEKLGLDNTELEKPKENINPCLMACVFKETGAVDAKGMFDKDASLTFLKKVLKDEDSINKAIEYGKICEKVNDEDVSDGEEGCERAALLRKCFSDLNAGVMD